MSKKMIALYIVILLVGSIVIFYDTNLIMFNVLNVGLLSVDISQLKSLFVSFSFLPIALMFILALIYLYRLNLHSKLKEQMTKKYCIIAFCFAVAGLLFTILAATLVYGSFVTKYPFAGASILLLIFYVAMIVLTSLYLFIKAKDVKIEYKPENKGKYVFYTAVCSCLLFYAMNKLGAVLMLPVFAQGRTLGITMPYYLSLLLPIMFFIIYVLEGLKIVSFKNSKVLAIILLALVAISNLYLLIILKFSNVGPLFTASISLVVPLERLATMPIDSIFRPLLMLGLSIYYLIHTNKLAK